MKIVIIKLGAKGDVIRTLPILISLKGKFPSSEITWITKPSSEEILKTSPHINRILTIPLYIQEKFDLLYNFDIEEEAGKLARDINAKKKHGFFFDEGYPAAFNPPAEYYLNTLFDDELKKSNKKTYQQMMFDAAELDYNKQHHKIYLTEQDKKYAEAFLAENNLNSEKLIGIHLGASARWPSKVWHSDNLKEFIALANKEGHGILLFGGPDEIEYQRKISEDLQNKGLKICVNDPFNSDREFCALVDTCKSIISGDSFALHVALALKKPTVGLFFCTSPKEVEGYNLLRKSVSPMLDNFFPEKSDQYSEELTKSISAEEVLREIKSMGPKEVVNAIIKEGEKVLLIKRKKDEGIHPGRWAFPGGVVEEGETKEKALRRELKEELGVEINEIVKKIADYEYKRLGGTDSKGESYLITLKNKDIEKNHEIEDYRWINLEELNNYDLVEGLEDEALLAFSDEQNT